LLDKIVKIKKNGKGAGIAVLKGYQNHRFNIYWNCRSKSLPKSPV